MVSNKYPVFFTERYSENYCNYIIYEFLKIYKKI